MFSVIIPVYNGEEFINTAIISIFEQTYKEWELIIVNDGSTDNTLKLLSKYKNPRIRVITQENGGAAAARNTGMKAAKYPYIAFLDADDVWLPRHLEVMYDMIKQYPDAGMYCSFAETHLPDGGIVKDCNFFKKRPQTIYLEDFFEEYAKDKSAKMYYMISTCVAAQAVKKAGGFPEGCAVGEDLEFSLKISAYYPVVLTSRKTAIYRRENSTATKDISFDPDWHFFDEVQKLYNDPQIPKKKKDHIRECMQWFTIRRVRHYMIDGRREEAVKIFKQIGRTKLKKDKLLTAVLIALPQKLVKRIFLVRWRYKA